MLVHVGNPDGVLREATRGNNGASVLLELRRPPGRAPVLEILGRCPDSARCGS